jgi:AraC-like DNA-binding protein/DNA gyrase inhibitor GyrI
MTAYANRTLWNNRKERLNSMKHSNLYKTDRAKIQYVDALVDYIERHIAEDLSVDKLAAAGFVSRSKVYRDFYNITGHPVKEYIRRRRLSISLALVKKSKFSLADIANECGYSSQQAFCRSVRKGVGMTPYEYSKRDCYYFFPPFQGEYLFDISVMRKDFLNLHCLKYYSSKLSDIEKHAVDEIRKLIPEYSGSLFGRNGLQVRKQFCYELYLTDVERYIEVLKNSKFEIKEKTESFSGYYAMTVVKNEKELINRAWDYIYKTWLVKSMYIYDNKPYFEEYLISEGLPKRLRLYLPIIPGDKFPDIHIVEKKEMQFIVAEGRGKEAEKRASRIIKSYLARINPDFIKSISDFFIQEAYDKVICGIKVNSTDKCFDGMGSLVKKRIVPEGTYLSLNGEKAAEYGNYKEVLISFAKNNGINLDTDSIFGVYVTDYGFQNPRLSLYGRIKLKQNDNTK